MVRVAVCDDVSEYLDANVKLLELYQNKRLDVKIKASKFDSPASLLEHIEGGGCFEIYLLDIVMPEFSGIELARQIQKHDERASFIFLTSSTGHALDAFGVSAVSYILKPIDEKQLFPVLDKIIASIIREDNSFILVNASYGGTIKMLYSTIDAVEYIGRILRYFKTDGEVLDSRTIRTPFLEAVTALLEDRRFLNVHQSFVINMDNVQRLDTMSFVMKSGITVPIPKPKYTNIKNKYFNYLAQSNKDRQR